MTSCSSLTALKIHSETSTSSIISTSLKVTLEARPIQNWSTHLFLLTLAVTSTLLDSHVFGTLSLLWTSPYQSTLSKTLLLTSSGPISQPILTPLIRVLTTIFVLVPNVSVLILLLFSTTSNIPDLDLHWHYPRLLVLDTTDPQCISNVLSLKLILFILSFISGL